MDTYKIFLDYVRIPTMSDEESESIPSTKKQLVLANLLKDQLLELGLVDARVDEYGYVYASLPANTDKKVDTVGFIAHMDTSSEASDENIKPQIVEYLGGDILMNAERGIYMRESDYPCLKGYANQHLVITDGTTPSINKEGDFALFLNFNMNTSYRSLR